MYHIVTKPIYIYYIYIIYIYNVYIYIYIYLCIYYVMYIYCNDQSQIIISNSFCEKVVIFLFMILIIS